MIHHVFSSVKTFKELEFNPSLNVLIAKKEIDSSEKQTRNRAGKSSLIEIIHFLTGANVKKDSIFLTDELVNESFGMEFDLKGEKVKVLRSGIQKSKVHLTSKESLLGEDLISIPEWNDILGAKIFELPKNNNQGDKYPSFRSLFGYFVRRQESNAFITPEKQASLQQINDYQMALMYLLGLDWRIASDWQNTRDKEKTIKELHKASSSDTLGNILGKSSELRTKLTVAEAQLRDLNAQIASFQIYPQYREMENEADLLTKAINNLTNDDVIDLALIRDLEKALENEAPPPIEELKKLYAEAGVVLPNIVLKRYEDVKSFHQSVIRNRRDYLYGELELARQRLDKRRQEISDLDKRRSKIIGILKSYGALDQFSKLQEESGRLNAEVESIREKFETAERIEGTKNELDIERNRLVLRLQRDFTEQANRLSEAILAFETTSKKLYESAGSINIDKSSNGPVFKFPIQGSRSKGIKNMQIFCFDMMLMQLCENNGIGPGFLIHDSHLFDGVDGRQVISALKVGAETAEEFGFQYIVTMNEDDAFKEKIDGFDLQKYILPVVLTDAKEDGGLFGFRF